jgi:capsular exopolysaccharide synthesis family protein
MFDRLKSDPEASRVVVSLRRRWPLILAVAVIGAAAAYLLANQQAKKYSATSALLFQKSQLDQRLFGNQVVSSTTDPARQAATNLALVELPSVAKLVAAKLNIPKGRVTSEIAFGSDTQSDVLTVTATDRSPSRAAQIANTYVQQYIVFRQTADQQQLTGAEKTVQTQLAAIPPAERGSALAQSLQSRSYELGLLASLQTGDAEVVQTANPPSSPSSPTPGRDGIIGGVLGLLLGSAIGFMLDRRDRRIKSALEVEEIYGVPVLGMVPESPALRAAGAAGSPRDQDAFRMMRAQLRYFDVDRNIQHVLVTSSASGEGKSIVSLNLARAAAQSDDKRALLIEADLRRPALTGMIGLESVAGLAELVSHSQDLASGLRELVVTPEEGDNPASTRYDVLLAGATPPNPVELLESKRMADLLDYAATIYDIIIIDTPPIGVVSDPIPLVHQVDGVLVVSRVDYTRRDHAARLMKQLRDLNAHIFGVVINGLQPTAGGYSSYYGYHGYAPDEAPQDRRGWRVRQRASSTKSR